MTPVKPMRRVRAPRRPARTRGSRAAAAARAATGMIPPARWSPAEVPGWGWMKLSSSHVDGDGRRGGPSEVHVVDVSHDVVSVSGAPTRRGPAPAGAGTGPSRRGLRPRHPRGSGAGSGSSSRSCSRRGSQLQPARQVPVAVAEEGHRGGQEHRAHDGGVDQDRRRQADPHLLEVDDGQQGEDAEHRDHHDGRAGDHAGRAADAVLDRVTGVHAAVVELADLAQDEHVVVHREPEQDHEHEHREPRGDAAGGVEVEQVLAPAPLEHGDHDAEGGGHRQQVQDDRLEGHDDGPEGEQQDPEGEAASRSRTPAAPSPSCASVKSRDMAVPPVTP